MRQQAIIPVAIIIMGELHCRILSEPPNAKPAAHTGKTLHTDANKYIIIQEWLLSDTTRGGKRIMTNVLLFGDHDDQLINSATN